MFITRWYEWQLRNDHAEPLPANFRKDRCPRRCGVRRHIAHGDGNIEAHREPAGSHDTDRRCIALVTEQRSARAHWRPPFWPQPDALTSGPHATLLRKPRRVGRAPTCELFQDRFGPWKAAGAVAARAACLADRPIERRLDGRRGLVKIGAVETQAGLEPEAVARAEPDRRDRGIAQHRIAQRLSGTRRHADLEAV